MQTTPLTPRATPPRATRKLAPSGNSSDLERAVCLFGGLFVLVNLGALSYFCLPHPEIHSHLLAHRQSRAAAAAATAEKAAAPAVTSSPRQSEQELPAPPPPQPAFSPPPPPPPQQTREQQQQPEAEPTLERLVEQPATDT